MHMKKEEHAANKTLSLLCREHYNDIALVCTIRRAIRYSVSTDKIAAHIRQEFVAHLDRHFKEEELWLFPKLANTNALRVQAEKQHERLRKMVDDGGLIPEEFANLLEEHIRFEERTLFPLFEQIINTKNEPVNYN